MENKTKFTSIKINLLKIEESLNQPQLLSLIKEGWSIFSHFPVDDQGTPTLMIFLKSPEKTELTKVIQNQEENKKQSLNLIKEIQITNKRCFYMCILQLIFSLFVILYLAIKIT